MKKNQKQRNGLHSRFLKKVGLFCFMLAVFPSLGHAIDWTPKYAGGMHIGYGTS